MSETYTAVYARDGEEWVAEIAEMGLTTRGSNVGEVRTRIRDALAQQLTTSPGELAVIDQFADPRAAQQQGGHDCATGEIRSCVR